MIKILKSKSANKGSIALISVLIISAILLIVTVSMSENNISTSYEQLNTSSNKTVYYTAESCLEEAIYRLEDDTAFAGTTLNFDEPGLSCNITVSGVSPKIVQISVVYGDYTENYSSEIDVADLGSAHNAQLNNWNEI